MSNQITRAEIIAEAPAKSLTSETIMTIYTRPIFRAVRERRTLSVSASTDHADTRMNLGEITLTPQGLQFVPNNVSTGGAEAADAVRRWLAARKGELLDLMAETYDPTMRSDRAALALIETMRTT